MKGCKPLSDDEVSKLLKYFKGEFQLRNKLLVIFGITTGFRISEILSLKVKDVYQNGKIVDRVSVAKSSMKGNTESRSALLRKETKFLIDQCLLNIGYDPDTYLFLSRQGGNSPIDRTTAWNILNTAKIILRIEGKIGTHCMRKTYANKMYDALDHDLVKLQKAMGHQWVSTTASYISFREEEIDEAVEAIQFGF